MSNKLTPLVVHLMGITNAGKSTVIDAAKKNFSNAFGFVEVGKEMRRRYPPEHFKGQGAMASTEAEVIQIYNEQINAAIDSDVKIILVDGQPRMLSQIDMVATQPRRHYVILKEDDEVILDRIKKRDGDDPERLKLSKARYNNDRIQLFDVVTELLRRKESVSVVSIIEDFAKMPVLFLHQLIENEKMNRTLTE